MAATGRIAVTRERRCSQDEAAGRPELERSANMSRTAWIGTVTMACTLIGMIPAIAADKAEIDKDAQAALSSLYASVPAAKELGTKATAILVFPKITKAGLGIGGLHGDGALIQNGKSVAYYSTSGGSFGLQAGVQTYGYALFLMNDKAVQSLNAAKGFEVGVGPSVVLVDEGKAKQLTTTTTKDDIYAFVFGQKGLMAGIGIQGNKITKINPK
jgi:lipid-binding SYLF domain-containing protein